MHLGISFVQLQLMMMMQSEMPIGYYFSQLDQTCHLIYFLLLELQCVLLKIFISEDWLVNVLMSTWLMKTTSLNYLSVKV